MFFKETRNFVTGFTLGVGVGLLSREIYPYVKEVVRPLAKGALKGAILGMEKAREGFFRFGEVLEDITAEVKSELRVRHVAHGKRKVKKGGKLSRPSTKLRRPMVAVPPQSTTEPSERKSA